MKLNLEKIYKSKIFVTLLFIVGLFSIVAFTFLIPPTKKNEQLAFETHSQPETQAVLGSSDVKEDATEYIYVQISGAIKKPQVAKLKKGARVFELIEMSGGFTDDVSNAFVNKILNLAKVLIDGEKLYIPFSIEELDSNFATKYTTDETESTIVNINTANKQQLTTLPNVGESTADKIIDYRTKNGPFIEVEDIKNVSGIGDKTFEDIKDLITV